MGEFQMDPSYVEVSERITEFRKKYPDGSLQSEIVELPAAFAEKFVGVKAYAYRTPDDPRPGTGLAWEPVPGKTPYTKDSELMNGETSAWGRAIVAALAADTRRGIASAEEIRNRAPVAKSKDRAQVKAEKLDDGTPITDAQSKKLSSLQVELGAPLPDIKTKQEASNLITDWTRRANEKRKREAQRTSDTQPGLPTGPQVEEIARMSALLEIDPGETDKLIKGLTSALKAEAAIDDLTRALNAKQTERKDGKLL